MGYAAFSLDREVAHLEIEVQKGDFRGNLTLTLTAPTAEAIASFAAELRSPTLSAANLSIDDFGLLNISVSSRDRTGHYAISIELSYDGNSAKVALVVDYSQILEFSNQLRTLIEGRVENFTVQEF
ncbi:hypothetical protein [Mesorhizobium sp. ANAO-SY3R2]|uniref:hypothetical protein n=1 Tax=Mesorhizobium sp. ANAO-SY3R2 TaxID=3166644 RepID=UPI00366C8495